jgi:hypothetical protein
VAKIPLDFFTTGNLKREATMKRRFWLSAVCAGAMMLAGVALFAALPSRWEGSPKVEAAAGPATQGALRVLGKDGRPAAECPLKRTEVNAEISGSLARVRVAQEFVNPSWDKVEAIYVFPLPQGAAVDEMTMLVGDRTIKGAIKRREEARAIYDAARNAGHVAALLDQERPNIFTQSVAGRDRQGDDQLRGALEIRGRQLFLRLPDGGGAALHSGGADRRAAGPGMGAGHEPGARRLAHHAANDGRRNARRA